MSKRKTVTWKDHYSIGQLGLSSGGNTINDLQTVSGKDPRTLKVQEEGNTYFPISIVRDDSGKAFILLKKGYFDTATGKPKDVGSQVYRASLEDNRDLVSHKIDVNAFLGGGSTNAKTKLPESKTQNKQSGTHKVGFVVN